MRKKAIKIPLPTEKQIENSILDYLQIVPKCKAWKNQTTGVFDPKLGFFRVMNNKHNGKGSSDILACINGYFVAIEVKRTHKSKVSAGQTDFINKIIKAGGVAFVACSIEDVIKSFKIYNLI